MSARNRSFVLSAQAQQDFKEILGYSRARWGIEQRRVYEQELRAALINIRRYHEIGASREEWYPGLRALPVGRHIIYYRVLDSEVRVNRIVHGARDIQLSDILLGADDD